jgi:3-oxoacyl-[acyl-carrier protein] reductase
MPPDASRSVRPLAGQRAVVTGSTSGIGRAIVRELAAAGAACLVHGRNRDAAEKLAEELRTSGSDVAIALVDLSDKDGPARLADAAYDAGRDVDIWINNAGADVLTGEGASGSFDEKLDMLWKVDVLATIGLSRIVGARMKKRSAGVIVNMGWDRAMLGMEGESGEMFAAVKGAIMAFTKSLAISLAPEVRVTCLAPGWIKTAWGSDASDDWQQRAVDDSLLRRWGTPEDVARVARFLASPDASFINGQTIAVNGGEATGSARRPLVS